MLGFAALSPSYKDDLAWFGGSDGEKSLAGSLGQVILNAEITAAQDQLVPGAREIELDGAVGEFHAYDVAPLEG